MRTMFRVFPLVALFLATGCATNGQTTLLGSGIGALLGSAIGVAVDAGPRGRARTQNLFIGATFGSLFGGSAGLIFHDTLKGKEKEAPPSTEKSPISSGHPRYGGVPGQPVLLPPRVETRYIDDQVRGNTFVPGHLEYQIAEPSQWSR